jgi:hypothetical protein
VTLFLVGQGRALVDRTRPAAEWELDPSGFDDVWALRESGRLPEDAAWFCASEAAAVGTAQLLTEGDVGIVEDLGGHDADRVLTAVRRIRDVHAGEDVVLVGDGAAWNAVAATLAMPDVLVVAVRRAGPGGP